MSGVQQISNKHQYNGWSYVQMAIELQNSKFISVGHLYKNQICSHIVKSVAINYYEHLSDYSYLWVRSL